MPPKNVKKDRVQPEEDPSPYPPPPNVFLYVQLASIERLPVTGSRHQLEIHISQADSLIVKCDEHYNTDGIILEGEFHKKPTFTLIFKQDNVDRINHAANNPLLIQLYMRLLPPVPSVEVEEEMYADEEGLDEDIEVSSSSRRGSLNVKVDISSNMGVNVNVDKDVKMDLEDEFVSGESEQPEEFVLLSVGYLDVIKLFGHRRSMIKEQLFLYSMPDVPDELRSTVNSEWHLYTLLPIAKELTFVNMAFVTLESIYCLKEDYNLEVESMRVQLNFRSKKPGDKNDTEVIPLCEFSHLERMCISAQDSYQVFESFRRTVSPSNVTGLKSAMQIEMFRLFSGLACSDGLVVDFSSIDLNFDQALVCNSFHRYILTQQMADVLSYAITCQQYVLAVEVFQDIGGAKPQKVFQGVLDPCIMTYPDVQNMRFAVQLEYLGKLKPRQKSLTQASLSSTRYTMPTSNAVRPPTFAIIRLCLLAPIGEIYKELKVFRESFVEQNRLLACHSQHHPSRKMPLAAIQQESYARFDKFIRDCITFIVDKNVRQIEDRRPFFCCAVQNLTNILMKVVGSVYNTRFPTQTNVEFANLCAFVYNELEPRVYSLVEKAEAEGFENYSSKKQMLGNRIIDHLNTIKLLTTVNDDVFASILLEKIEAEYQSDERFHFFMLIAHMERGEYDKVKAYFSQNHMADNHDYLAGWIKLYINYVDTRDNPETTCDCTECLLRSITIYAELHPLQPEGWILLYCYYRHFNYEPGCAFARWRFEDHQGNGRFIQSEAPHSMWSIYLTVDPNFPSARGHLFFQVFKSFVRLGLYEFAQMVFASVEHLCDNADRYMIKTQMAILLHKLDDNFVLQSFQFGEGEEADQAAAMNAQVNGNVEYYRGNLAEAALYYECCLTLPPLRDNERDFFEVSKIRLGYISYEMGNYDKCIEALEGEFAGQMLPLVTSYLIGKSYYKIHSLDEALECFAKCTRLESHIPNVWGFLALINLRLGENFKAIECWKYAKIEPVYGITDQMIFDELDAVDYDSVDLYIDIPGKVNEYLIEDTPNTV